MVKSHRVFLWKEIFIMNYEELDKRFLEVDKRHILRTRNLQMIPNYNDRKGGKISYAEWAHVIGIFQTLIGQAVGHSGDKMILDVGCGNGLLAIASMPFLGHYIGIDVMKDAIDFCCEHYDDRFEFVHLNANNPVYAKNGERKIGWPLQDDTFDLVTALSVWTHFSEEDARFYMQEVRRVLKKNGKAIVTFFLLDELYDKMLGMKERGKFNATNENWIFDKDAYGSQDWFCLRGAKVPENAIGVTELGFKDMIQESGFKIEKKYLGNWKEVPGVFFQDVVVLL